jgi:hypothetical protein
MGIGSALLGSRGGLAGRNERGIGRGGEGEEVEDGGCDFEVEYCLEVGGESGMLLVRKWELDPVLDGNKAEHQEEKVVSGPSRGFVLPDSVSQVFKNPILEPLGP